MPEIDMSIVSKCSKHGVFSRFCSLPIVLGILGVIFSTSSLQGQLEGFDEFSDGSKDTEKWDDDFIQGQGKVSELSGRLEFSNSRANGNHEAGWPWVFSTAAYSEDWEFQSDLFNAVEVEPSQFASAGIYVASLEDERDLAFIEMYASYYDELNQSAHGFSAGLESGSGSLHEADSFELPIIQGAVRIRFDHLSQALHFYYHAGETSNGYAWLKIASYGIAGNGGDDSNDHWRLNSNSEFDIGIYGYAENISIRSGELSLDNFTADGSHALPNPEVMLYVEDVTTSTMTIGWEAFENYTFELQESVGFNQWKPTDLRILGDGLYQTFQLDRQHPSNFFRVVTMQP